MLKVTEPKCEMVSVYVCNHCELKLNLTNFAVKLYLGHKLWVIILGKMVGKAQNLVLAYFWFWKGKGKGEFREELDSL